MSHSGFNNPARHQSSNHSQDPLLGELANYPMTFREKDYLFKSGHPLSGIYYIFSGVVKLENIEGGEPFTFYLARDGDFLGLNDIFHYSATHTVNAQALTLTKSGFLSTEHYFTLIKENPQFSMDILSRLNGQIERMEDQSDFSHHWNARKKILQLLNKLISDFGLDANNFLKIPLSPEELADLSGISKTYMRKLLPSFREKNLFESRKKCIRIISPQKMRSF